MTRLILIFDFPSLNPNLVLIQVTRAPATVWVRQQVISSVMLSFWRSAHRISATNISVMCLKIPVSLRSQVRCSVLNRGLTVLVLGSGYAKGVNELSRAEWTSQPPQYTGPCPVIKTRFLSLCEEQNGRVYHIPPGPEIFIMSYGTPIFQMLRLTA